MCHQMVGEDEHEEEAVREQYESSEIINGWAVYWTIFYVLLNGVRTVRSACVLFPSPLSRTETGEERCQTM